MFLRRLRSLSTRARTRTGTGLPPLDFETGMTVFPLRGPYRTLGRQVLSFLGETASRAHFLVELAWHLDGRNMANTVSDLCQILNRHRCDLRRPTFPHFGLPCGLIGCGVLSRISLLALHRIGVRLSQVLFRHRLKLALCRAPSGVRLSPCRNLTFRSAPA